MKKRSLVLVLALVMLCTLFPVSSMAANEEITGKVVIYTSMYQDIIDMMDEALAQQFPNCDVEFFYGGTGTLQTKLAGEMEVGTLGCDMLMVAEPAYSLELKEGGWLHPYVTSARDNMRFDYDEKATGTACAYVPWAWPTTPRCTPRKKSPPLTKLSPMIPPPRA